MKVKRRKACAERELAAGSEARFLLNLHGYWRQAVSKFVDEAHDGPVTVADPVWFTYGSGGGI